MKNTITDKIESDLTSSIQEFTAKLTQTFNAPNSFQAYPGVNITYYFTNLISSANQWAKATANGYLQAQDPETGQWLTYVDPNINDANMTIPMDWPWQSIINQ